MHSGSSANSVGAVAPPIHLSTTFHRDPKGDLQSDFIYGRSGNPDRAALEQAIADLEEGADCVSFASGLAAVHSLLLTLSPGDVVLAPRDAYHGTMRLAKESLGRWGLRTRFIDFLDPDDVSAGLAERPALAILETPSNPSLRITDIAAVADRCHAAGTLVAVDNTWMTPILQRPLSLGADIVIHATTKYFGGHSDVTGGAVVVREGLELTSRLRFMQTETGPVPSPFDAWLLRRGMKTLPVRVRAQSENAGRLAECLSTHPGVTATFYPGLPSDPGHVVQSRQGDGYGAMLSFRARDEDHAKSVLSGSNSSFARQVSGAWKA